MLFEDAYFIAIEKDKSQNNKITSLFFKVSADSVDSDTHVIMPKFKYILS